MNRPPLGQKPPVSQKPPLSQMPPVTSFKGTLPAKTQLRAQISAPTEKKQALSNKRPREETTSHQPTKRPAYGSGTQPGRQTQPQVNRPNKRGYNQMNETS